MMFLAEQTLRLRGKNPLITFEQVVTVVSTLVAKIWVWDWRTMRTLLRYTQYHQARNAASYESRRRHSILVDTS
jgi:hypothetical protein